tara:strand:- start:1041 stop:1706 length:666 start_codon:yes stop_codon:yes gene_type:complete
MRVEFNGLDAAHDMIDLRELSISLGGTAKLLRMSSHLLFADELPESKTPIRTKFYAKPFKEGCFPVDIIGSVDGDMFSIASETVAAIGAERGRSATIDVVHPVGRTCSEQTVGDQKLGGVNIDLPTAQSIRSGLKLEIGDMAEFNVLLDGVIIHNRTCRLYVEGEGEKVVTGDLVDPVADDWPNIYQDNLNKRLRITAKPTYRDGQLYRLAVYDAKPLEGL